MTLEEIKTYVQNIVQKDVSGKTMTEENYNIFLKVVNTELFNKEFLILQQAASDLNLPLNRYVYNSISLNEFKIVNYSMIMGIGGSMIMPSNYKYYLDIKIDYEGKIRDVEVVSDEEFSQVISNLYIENPAWYPKAKIVKNWIYFIPSDVETGKISYLKTPDIPFYDYVIKTSNNKIYYMPVGSCLAAGASGQTLYTDDTLTTIIAEGITHLDDPTLPYISQTVEFEWRKGRHVELSSMIIDKVLQSQKDVEGYQINVAEKQTA